MESVVRFMTNHPLRAGIIFLSLGVFLSSTGDANVFGKDHRVTARVLQKPYNKIGKIFEETGNKSFGCTGSLVGPNVVLSNLHCVRQIIANKNEGSVVFRAGYSNGKSIIDANVIGIKARYRKTEKGMEYHDEDDYAFLYLDKPLGDILGTFRIVPSSTPYLGASVTLAGYSRDIKGGDVMAVHIGCTIREIIDYRVLHDCDSTRGSSGAPIFISENGEDFIIALHKGQHTGDAPPGDYVVSEYVRKFSNVAVNAELFKDVPENSN